MRAARIRYPDPVIKVNDTVKIDLVTGKITEFIRFDTGVIAMATGGRNMGRVGVITHRERHDGGFNIVHIKDAIDNSFATRESNVFVIGREKPWISLPKGKGVSVTLLPRILVFINFFTGSFLLPKSEIAVVHMLLLVTKWLAITLLLELIWQGNTTCMIFMLQVSVVRPALDRTSKLVSVPSSVQGYDHSKLVKSHDNPMPPFVLAYIYLENYIFWLMPGMFRIKALDLYFQEIYPHL